MQISSSPAARAKLFSRGLFLLVLLALAGSSVRAGLTFTLDLYVSGGAYVFFTPLNTNGLAPAVPFGTYTVTSPGQPTNGAWRQFTYDTNGFNVAGGSENNYPDLASAIQQITNGLWTLTLTNATTTNAYQFTVTLPGGLTTNQLPATLLTASVGGTGNLTNLPTFTWTGQPTHWPVAGSAYVDQYGDNGSFFCSTTVTTAQTNWTVAAPIPASNPGSYTYFNLNYVTNYTGNLFVASTPTNGTQSIGGWTCNSTLESGVQVSFTVAPPPPASTNHTLVAHYTFDDSGDLGADSSVNGNNFECGSSWGPNYQQFTSVAETGNGAVEFFGDSSMTDCGGMELTDWRNALLGSFTVSAWIKTATVVGNDTDSLDDWDGQTVIYLNNNGNGVIPLGITGTKAAVATGVAPGASGQDTLHSSGTVTAGSYVHVVVTRDAGSGLKEVYLNGVLDSSDFGEPGFLDGGANYASMGGELGAPYTGELDDVQIYSGVLSASDVANLFASPGSTIPNGSSSGGHTILAYYTFEDDNLFAHDFSGHGNNMAGYAWFTTPPYMTNDAEAGSWAVGYTGSGWQSPPTNLVTTLAGSFTVSLWAKTTNSPGNDTDDAGSGAGLLAANSDQVIPLALTGSKLAFLTGGGTPDTLHSATSINTGHYVHLVVTREQTTGAKKIYVNGSLDASDYGNSGPLNTASDLALLLGMNSTFAHGFLGEMDEVQIYSGVLSDSEVAYLYNHPGTNVADVAANVQELNTALGTTNLNWADEGDTSWFLETTNTYDGSPEAVQSGTVTNDQTSVFTTTITGPGTLTFAWSNIANDPNQGFYCEFDLDANTANWISDSLSGDTGWYQDGPFTIGAGQHTISWTAYANGDTDPTQAAFLDQVSYLASNPNTAPVITANPFNQTNYPGYNVALLAAATSNPAATWEWFKLGSSAAIPNATNALYIPIDSGSNSVAGSYYAVASNVLGWANTTTAIVSFASAPLPPGWSHAVKSPFTAVDASTFTKDYYAGCAVDSAGEIYAAAQYVGNMEVLTNGNLESTLNSVGTNGAAALVKHDANGNPLWAMGLTNNLPGSSSWGYAVAPAPGNGAYLMASLSGTNWLGTNQLPDQAGGSLVLARFAANGSNVWSRFIGGTNAVGTDYNCLYADNSGNVTLVGNISGTLSLGGTTISAGSGGGFVVQYDTNGAVRWAQTIPVYAYGVAGANGLLFVSLQSAISGGVTNVSIGSLSNVTDRAWGVACLNAANGQALWLRSLGSQYGANQTSEINDMPRVSVSGTNVFLTANAYGATVVFGNLSAGLPAGRGQYLARYDTNGNPQWATCFGSATTMIWATAANASGVYVTGDFDDYSQFGTKLIAAPVYAQSDLDESFNGLDILYFTQPFIAKFDLAGNPLWARNGISSDEANFRGIALATDGVWASGFLKITNSIPAQFGTNSVDSDLYVVDAGVFALLEWTEGGMLAKITEATSATPVTLLNLQDTGANFQFQFLSQYGFSHSVLYNTNLATGSGWQTYTNLAGDGTLKTVNLPLSVFNPAQQGFIRVATQ